MKFESDPNFCHSLVFQNLTKPLGKRVAAAILVAFALTTSCQRPDQARPPSSATVQATRSLNSDTSALITFVNQSGQPLNVYWLDFGGNRQLYKTLEAGGSYTQQTFLTHPWLVTDMSGQPWKIYMPEAQPRTVILQTRGGAQIAQ